MAAEDYFDFDDHWEDPSDRYLREQRPKPKSTPGYLGPHHGEAWTSAQNHKLVVDFRNGYPISDIANRMGRTVLAITCRLEKLGIDPSAPRTNNLPVTPQSVKEPTVNKMHLITLLQEGYTTARVCFDDKCQGQTYTYKVPNSMGVAAGDMLVVPANDTFKVVWVKSVDGSPKIDVNAPFVLKWAVQKVDVTAYNDQVQRETQAVEQIEEEQRLDAQRKAMELLIGPMGDPKKLLDLINPK